MVLSVLAETFKNDEFLMIFIFDVFNMFVFLFLCLPLLGCFAGVMVFGYF